MFTVSNFSVDILYVDLALERIVKLHQFWNIRRTYHMQTKQDSERRVHPTLAPSYTLSTLSSSTVLRLHFQSQHNIDRNSNTKHILP